MVRRNFEHPVWVGIDTWKGQYYPYFMDEETKAQKKLDDSPRPQKSK